MLLQSFWSARTHSFSSFNFPRSSTPASKLHSYFSPQMHYFTFFNFKPHLPYTVAACPSIVNRFSCKVAISCCKVLALFSFVLSANTYSKLYILCEQVKQIWSQDRALGHTTHNSRRFRKYTISHQSPYCLSPATSFLPRYIQYTTNAKTPSFVS